MALLSLTLTIHSPKNIVTSVVILPLYAQRYEQDTNTPTMPGLFVCVIMYSMRDNVGPRI